MATDVSFFKNKNPGASFDETSWLYALYAKKNLSQCKIPTDSADAKKSQSIVNAARNIIDGYIAFTWSPTPMSLILAIRFYNSFRDTDFIVLVTYKGANVIVS